MREQTLQVIAHRFDNDLDEAKHEAEIRMRTDTNPPAWVTDIVGPRPGWKHPTSFHLR